MVPNAHCHTWTLLRKLVHLLLSKPFPSPRSRHPSTCLQTLSAPLGQYTDYLRRMDDQKEPEEILRSSRLYPLLVCQWSCTLSVSPLSFALRILACAPKFVLCVVLRVSLKKLASSSSSRSPFLIKLTSTFLQNHRSDFSQSARGQLSLENCSLSMHPDRKYAIQLLVSTGEAYILHCSDDREARTWFNVLQKVFPSFLGFLCSPFVDVCVGNQRRVLSQSKRETDEERLAGQKE